jgi:hypothetical protein
LYRPVRLGIDSWAPSKVYKYGFRRFRKDDIVEMFAFKGEFWQRLKEKEPRAVFRFLVLERMLSKAARIFFTSKIMQNALIEAQEKQIYNT